MMPHYPRKTKRTFNSPHHAHFLTYSTQHRLPLLGNARVSGWIIDAIASARSRHDLDVWAFVIMPEHVHVFINPRSKQYSVERILSDLKRPVSWHAKQHLMKQGRDDWLQRLTVLKSGRAVFRFWQQGGGYDENIVHQKSIPAVVDYIEQNPVRRGLVKSAVEWPWSSARARAGMGPVPIELDPLPTSM